VTTTLLATVLRRQIKSGDVDPLEKVTGHQDGKPSTTEFSTRRAPMLGKTAAGENEVLNNTLLEEQPYQQLCLRNNPNSKLEK
jgi:hypothetical protein